MRRGAGPRGARAAPSRSRPAPPARGRASRARRRRARAARGPPVATSPLAAWSTTGSASRAITRVTSMKSENSTAVASGSSAGAPTAAKLGCTTISVPAKPTAQAASRCGPTCSPGEPAEEQEDERHHERDRHGVRHRQEAQRREEGAERGDVEQGAQDGQPPDPRGRARAAPERRRGAGRASPGRRSGRGGGWRAAARREACRWRRRAARACRRRRRGARRGAGGRPAGPARRRSRSHSPAGAPQARSTYSIVSVETTTASPSPTKGGIMMRTPLSRIAGLKSSPPSGPSPPARSRRRCR